jgi:hypothetical protein
MEVVSILLTYVMGKRREVPRVRACHASSGGVKGVRHACVNGLLKFGPSPWGGGVQLLFVVFIFDDLHSKSTRYGNLNLKPIRFSLLTKTRGWFGFPIYIRPIDLHQKTHQNELRFCPSSRCCAAIVAFSILNAGMHRRTGEQVSETLHL